MRGARFLRWSAVAGLISLLGCAGAAVAQQDLAGPSTPRQLQAGQLIATLPEDAPEGSAATRRALAAEYGISEVGNFPLRAIRVQCVVFQVPAGRSLAAVIEKLNADPRVDSAQPNQLFRGLQAYHSRSYAALEYGAAAIRADVARRVSTGKGVNVAVVDTGVDTDHPDLHGRVVKIANFVERGESSFTRDRHGTAVAGVIAARADDGAGISGIAPDAELAAIKACWHPGMGYGKAVCSSWTLAKAVDHAINIGAQVLNLSLSGPSDALLARLLISAHGRGMTIVAAAAEDDGQPGFPASLPYVIAVVASDARGRVQMHSWAQGKFVLAAPGVDIITTAPQARYDLVSGSSVAAAHVSGVVALLLERSPHLSPKQTMDVLTTTAYPASNQAAARAVGIVDASAALAKLPGESARR